MSSGTSLTSQVPDHPFATLSLSAHQGYCMGLLVSAKLHPTCLSSLGFRVVLSAPAMSPYQHIQRDVSGNISL